MPDCGKDHNRPRVADQRRVCGLGVAIATNLEVNAYVFSRALRQSKACTHKSGSASAARQCPLRWRANRVL